MPAAEPSGGASELSRFRRLVEVTIATTFALIVIGGVVRISDSGLGCGAAGSGTDGWPLCGGRLLPFLEANAIIEFTHRAVAAVVAVLIVLLAWRAWRHLRSRRWLVRGTVLGGVLVLAQAALGGLTVEEGLHEVLVAAHLGLAMVLLGVLIALRRLTDPDPAPVRGSEGSGGLRALAGVAALLVLATIVAGGYVAGTEGEGTAREPAVGAHTACGEQFPTCAGEFMPFGRSGLIDAQLTHRAFMYLATIAVLVMFAVATRQRVRSPAFAIAAGLLGAQVLLGALNVWLGKHAGLIVAHLTLGTLLWSVVVYATLRLLPARGSATVRQPASTPARVTA